MNTKSNLLEFPTGKPIDQAKIFPSLTLPVRTLRDWIVLLRMTPRSQSEIVPTLSVVGAEFGGIAHTDEIRQIFEHRFGWIVINFQGDIFFLDGYADIGPTFPNLEPMLDLIESTGGYSHVPSPYFALRQIEEESCDAVNRAAADYVKSSKKSAKSFVKNGGQP